MKILLTPDLNWDFVGLSDRHSVIFLCLEQKEVKTGHTRFLSSLSTCLSASWASDEEVVLKKANEVVIRLVEEPELRIRPSRQTFLNN